MIRVLKTHTGDLAVLIEACSNLAKLAGIDENRVSITSAGGIPVLRAYTSTRPSTSPYHLPSSPPYQCQRAQPRNHAPCLYLTS